MGRRGDKRCKEDKAATAQIQGGVSSRVKQNCYRVSPCDSCPTHWVFEEGPALSFRKRGGCDQVRGRGHWPGLGQGWDLNKGGGA